MSPLPLPAGNRRRGHVPLASVLLAMPALLFYAGGGIHPDAADPPGWFGRVLAHWVHWNPSHLLWSTGAFLMLAACCERRGRLRFLVGVAVSAAAIPAALAMWMPDLAAYGGLSGIDSALFVLFALDLMHEQTRARRISEPLRVIVCSKHDERTSVRARRTVPAPPRSLVPAVLLALFSAKLLVEWLSGASLFAASDAAFTPVPLAHAVGGLAGALVFGGAQIGQRPLRYGTAVPGTRRPQERPSPVAPRRGESSVEGALYY